MAQLRLGLELSTKRTRKCEFLDAIRRVVPWSRLIALIKPHYPTGKAGRPPLPIATMLQIHFKQQWFGLSDAAMEESFCNVSLYRDFVGLGCDMTRLLDESTILCFRRLLEAHGLVAQTQALVDEILAAEGLMLKVGTVADAILISVPSSTKSGPGKLYPEVRPTQKGGSWYFGMKATSTWTRGLAGAYRCWRSGQCL